MVLFLSKNIGFFFRLSRLILVGRWSLQTLASSEFDFDSDEWKSKPFPGVAAVFPSTPAICSFLCYRKWRHVICRSGKRRAISRLIDGLFERHEQIAGLKESVSNISENSVFKFVPSISQWSDNTGFSEKCLIFKSIGMSYESYPCCFCWNTYFWNLPYWKEKLNIEMNSILMFVYVYV